MKKSKLLALILAGCIAVSSLTACGAASGTSAGGSAPASGSASAADGVSHLKIMGTEGWAPCTDWNEVGEYSAFKTLQGWLDEAKLDVEWEVITAEQYPVILQTRLASGNDLPDIVKVHTLDDAALLALAEQGLIIPINEIIDKYSAGPRGRRSTKLSPACVR